MLLWFWYCKWCPFAEKSFATGYKRYEINSVNKVYCQSKINQIVLIVTTRIAFLDSEISCPSLFLVQNLLSFGCGYSSVVPKTSQSFTI